MTNSEKPRVFLSHSSLDKPFVRDLDRALQAYGVDTFLDERDIGIGEDIPHRIFNEIHAAKYVCYVISANSVESQWVKDELSKASMLEKESKGVFVLPVLVEKVTIPIAVQNKRYADFTQEIDKPIHQRTAFRLLLTSIGIDPTRFEPKAIPAAQVLLDFAESTSRLIECLIDIRMRSSQICNEWPIQKNRPYLENIYDRLYYYRTTDLRQKVDAYEYFRKQLQPYVEHIESEEELRAMSDLLASFLDASMEIPSDPRRINDMSQTMSDVSHETNLIERVLMAILSNLLYLLGKGVVRSEQNC